VSGKAALAVFAGLALVVANLWSTQRSAVQALAQGKLEISDWGKIGLEFGGVVVAGFVAGVSDSAATMVLVLFGALWVLFAINVWGKGQAQVHTSPSPAPLTVIQGGKAA
jgi:hypothetical protein